jgi:hypothetical protein
MISGRKKAQLSGNYTGICTVLKEEKKGLSRYAVLNC